MRICDDGWAGWLVGGVISIRLRNAISTVYLKEGTTSCHLRGTDLVRPNQTRAEQSKSRSEDWKKSKVGLKRRLTNR